MWLADDDEISFSTIKEMYRKLSNSDAITVVPYWELINIHGKKKTIEPTIFNNGNLFRRIINYLYDSDDAFFYGLHKAKYLKRCEFNNYWWPNKNILSNWCYVFQFDIIMQGKVILLKIKIANGLIMIMVKNFIHDKQKKIFKYFAYFIRRINIFYLYLLKIIKWKKYNLILILMPILFFFH